jgi:FixJ family two-component response regulator
VNPHDHIVSVVDDDIRIRESLSELLASFDFNVWEQSEIFVMKVREGFKSLR